MTSSTQFRGVYAIPVTPFNEDLSVDWESLRKCIAFSVETGAHGIVLPVNASEGPFLTDAERKEVLKTGIKVVNGAVPVVAGVSGASTAVSVELTKNAAESGADAVMAMPPNGAAGQVVWDHYVAIAETGQLPVWIQNNKPPAGPVVPTNMMVKMLNEVKHVNYVKEELTEVVRTYTGGRGVDLVFENISNPKTWPKALKCLRKFGTLVTAGAHGGGKVELDCAFLYHQNIRIFGSTGSTDQNVSDTVALASEGKLKAKIEKIFPLSEIPAAHRMMEGEVLSGKIVLDPTAG